jgi:predicted DNA-binding protein
MANESDMLSVRIGEELIQRIKTVADALDKSQTQYVKEILDERTRVHIAEVEEIIKQQGKIADRENKRSSR